MNELARVPSRAMLRRAARNYPRTQRVQVRLIAAALVLACGPLQAQTIYRVTDLGSFGGSFTRGMAINAAGQVTGQSYTAGDAEGHAFLADSSGMVDLGTLGGIEAL